MANPDWLKTIIIKIELSWRQFVSMSLRLIWVPSEMSFVFLAWWFINAILHKISLKSHTVTYQKEKYKLLVIQEK